MTNLRRTLEAAFVAIPAALILIGLLSGALRVDLAGILTLIALGVLAGLTYVRYWGAYPPLLLLGIFLLFDRGFLAGITIALGVIYILIAALNLVRILRARIAARAEKSEGDTKGTNGNKNN